MENLQKLYWRFPLLSILSLVFGCLAIIVFATPENVYTRLDKDLIHSSVQLCLSILVVMLIVKCQWQRQTGLTLSYHQWPRLWWLAAVPMLLLAALNLINVDYSLLTFSSSRAVQWFFVNATTGFFEEVLLRGFCFYALYRAWHKSANPLFKAAIAQALIFGLAHFINLRNAELIDVVAQVTYATLFGIGFAGLMAYTRSLVLPVVIHTIINASGDVNDYFQLGYQAPPADPSTYIVAIVIIFLISALPGLVLLRKARLSQQVPEPATLQEKLA